MKSAKEAKIETEEMSIKQKQIKYDYCLEKISDLINQAIKRGAMELTIDYKSLEELYFSLHFCYPEVKTYLNDKGYSFEKQSSSRRWITSGSDQGSLQEYALSWKDAK